MPLIGASLHSSYSPETMELPIIGICPPEKAMEIINNWFTPPLFFSCYADIQSTNSDRNQPI